MKLAHVILDIPTQALDAPYTYAVPEEGLFAAACEGAGDEEGTDAQRDYAVAVGAAVLVPFGHRRAIGFVVDIREYGQLGGPDWPAEVDPAKLKAIVRAVSRPYFDEEGAACAQWLSERYIAPLSACVRLFTPPGGVPRMVRGRDGRWRLEQPAVGEVDDRWVVPGPALAAFVAAQERREAGGQVVEALRGGRAARGRAVRPSSARCRSALEGSSSAKRRGARWCAAAACAARRRRGLQLDRRRTDLRSRQPVPRFAPKPALTAGPGMRRFPLSRRACGSPAAGAWCWWTASRARARPRCTCEAIERVLAQGRTRVRAGA